MPRYKLFIRPNDIIAALGKDKQAEEEYLRKGYTLIGVAKIEDRYADNIFGVKIIKGGE